MTMSKTEYLLVCAMEEANEILQEFFVMAVKIALLMELNPEVVKNANLISRDVYLGFVKENQDLLGVIWCIEKDHVVDLSSKTTAFIEKRSAELKEIEGDSIQYMLQAVTNLSHCCSKILRFGLDGNNPTDQTSRKQHLIDAIGEYYAWLDVVHHNTESLDFFNQEAILAKYAKVNRYYNLGYHLNNNEATKKNES